MRLLHLKQNNAKQIQNSVLFQMLVLVKQNTETIPKCFGIVSELFWAHWHIYSHVEKYANPKTVSADRRQQ